MTLSMSTPNGAVLVAIGVAKNRNEVLLEKPGRTRRRTMTVLNAKADHERFVDVLGRYGRGVTRRHEEALTA